MKSKTISSQPFKPENEFLDELLNQSPVVFMPTGTVLNVKVNSDWNSIAVVSTLNEKSTSECSLSILDASSGNVKKSWPLDGEFLGMSLFETTIAVADSKQGLQLLDMKSSVLRGIVKSVISEPCFLRDGFVAGLMNKQCVVVNVDAQTMCERIHGDFDMVSGRNNILVTAYDGILKVVDLRCLDEINSIFPFQNKSVETWVCTLKHGSRLHEEHYSCQRLASRCTLCRKCWFSHDLGFHSRTRHVLQSWRCPRIVCRPTSDCNVPSLWRVWVDGCGRFEQDHLLFLPGLVVSTLIIVCLQSVVEVGHWWVMGMECTCSLFDYPSVKLMIHPMLLHSPRQRHGFFSPDLEIKQQ
jgi:hypothetical protein